MPIYGYKCKSCGHEQDEFHSMSGPNYKIKCKNCGSEKMNKQIGTPYVKFVGEDWDTNKNRGIQ